MELGAKSKEQGHKSEVLVSLFLVHLVRFRSLFPALYSSFQDHFSFFKTFLANAVLIKKKKSYEKDDHYIRTCRCGRCSL